MEESTKETKKFTYSELEQHLDKYKNAYGNLVEQNKALIAKLNEVTNVLNILPYYIDVIKNKHCFDEDFVKECSEQLRNVIIPIKEDKEETI